MLEDRLKKIAKELAHLDVMFKIASSASSPVALVRSNFNSIVKLIYTYRPQESKFSDFYSFVSYIRKVNPVRELEQLIPQLKTAVKRVRDSGHKEAIDENAIFAVENQLKHIVQLANKAYKSKSPELEDLYRNAWLHLDNNLERLRTVVLHLEKVSEQNG